MIAGIKNIIANAQESTPETMQETIARLAALAPFDYERVRETEAKRLGVRVSALDNEIVNKRFTAAEKADRRQMFQTVETWPEPVIGAALLSEIFGLIRRFIICSHETAVAVSLWIVMTWVIDFVQVAPLAIITAPEKRCGKSQLLNLILRLARRPLVASNISPSAIFRVIEAYNPTLGLDEADTFMRDNEELRGILNSGHMRQSAYVIRNVGDNHEPTQFSTWGAKALCGIGKLPDTLMDRAIVLELRRKLPNEKVERLRYAEVRLFERLSSKLARWAEDNGQAIESARPLLPEALNDRAQDNWEPLLAIADRVGEGWAKLARDAALKLSGVDDPVSLSAELLSDIRDVFQKRGADRISTTDLLRELNEDDMAPWATYNKGKPLSPRQLAKRLGEYGLKPGTIRIGTATPKGFLRPDFEDAFARYLMPAGNTPCEAATVQQTNESQMPSMDCSVADYPQRCESQAETATDNALEYKDSCAVADKNAVNGENITEVTL